MVWIYVLCRNGNFEESPCVVHLYTKASSYLLVILHEFKNSPNWRELVKHVANQDGVKHLKLGIPMLLFLKVWSVFFCRLLRTLMEIPIQHQMALMFWTKREIWWMKILSGKVHSTSIFYLTLNGIVVSHVLLIFSDTNYVLANYKTEQCKRPPRLCRQGYACPQYHNSRDKRRSPRKFKYRYVSFTSLRWLLILFVYTFTLSLSMFHVLAGPHHALV